MRVAVRRGRAVRQRRLHPARQSDAERRLAETVRSIIVCATCLYVQHAIEAQFCAVIERVLGRGRGVRKRHGRQGRLDRGFYLGEGGG